MDPSMSNGKDESIAPDHMIVLFSSPRSSSWIIPNDNANAYYIGSIRNIDAVTVVQYADLDLVPRQLGQEEQFRNCIAVIPRTEEEISQLAQLIWRPELGHSELWFLCQTPGDNPPNSKTVLKFPSETSQFSPTNRRLARSCSARGCGHCMKLNILCVLGRMSFMKVSG